MNSFTKYLKLQRKIAGFSSLESVIYALKENFPDSPNLIGKSTLHGYETGSIKNISPETMRLLASIYNISYKELANKWYENRYEISLNYQDNYEIKTPILSTDSRTVTLKGPLPGKKTSITIITMDEFMRIQSELPNDAEVAVAVDYFIDGTELYDIVSKNIKRGISYTYVLPKDFYLSYKSFIAKLTESFPSLENKIHNRRSFFIPRPNLDFPVSYVLYRFPSGKLQGYVGITRERDVLYMRVADPKLSWTLYESLRWTIMISSNTTIREKLYSFEDEIINKIMNSDKVSLRP